MKSKEISHEIIDVPVDTNVKFRTSTDPGSYIPMHWHRAVEIIYMQEGSLDVTIESENFTIQKGDCIVINGNVLHSTKCTSPNTAILLQIPLDFMEKYIPNPGKLIFSLIFVQKIRDNRPNRVCLRPFWNSFRSLMMCARMDICSASTA